MSFENPIPVTNKNEDINKADVIAIRDQWYKDRGYDINNASELPTKVFQAMITANIKFPQTRIFMVYMLKELLNINSAGFGEDDVIIDHDCLFSGDQIYKLYAQAGNQHARFGITSPADKEEFVGKIMDGLGNMYNRVVQWRQSVGGLDDSFKSNESLIASLNNIITYLEAKKVGEEDLSSYYLRQFREKKKDTSEIIKDLYDIARQDLDDKSKKILDLVFS